jgi:hypothetical protein
MGIGGCVTPNGSSNHGSSTSQKTAFEETRAQVTLPRTVISPIVGVSKIIWVREVICGSQILALNED